MNKSILSFSLFFFIIHINAYSQFRISGKVLGITDSAFKNQTVILQEKNLKSITDSSGYFEFNNLPNGTYHILVNRLDFKSSRNKVLINGENASLNISIQQLQKELDEVTVTEKKTDFGFTHMKAIDGMGLYEGKKTEVIVPDQLVANVSTNNARQVYARVAGLNIWENEGAGLQLSIGGRGLDPNRTSNFNVRQNGYDISADALGYPESYYTPPVEALDKIQLVRGAASLQYGTQFGGLLNFVIKRPVSDRKIQVLARQTGGSFGFYNTFTSLSGTVNKLSYYTFFQYKQGNGWRPNSLFNNYTYYANINYQISEKAKIGFDLTQMEYLAQQPGGLTDKMFLEEARQSNRERNWFKVNWTLMALHFDYKFNTTNEFNLRIFGLIANRYSIGFRPYRTASVDDNSERDLIKGDFLNFGAEARYLKKYAILKKNAVLLVGARYYYGFNKSQQGLGNNGKGADFTFINPDQFISYDYSFPNRNISAFIENIFYIHDKFSVTPGIRYENINTTGNGYYGVIERDLAGNIFNIAKTYETRNNFRHFLLGGIGISYKPRPSLNIYGNISQNYRSITFSDMRISNPSFFIDPNLQDEKGYSVDLGVRSEQTNFVSYDLGVFYLNYDNRIGEVLTYDANDRILRKRGNIGQAVIMGIESYAEADFLRIIKPKLEKWSGVLFANLALINSTYVKSEIPGVKGNQVEFVPKVNLKSGLRASYKNLKASFQFTYLSDQYSDATNALDGGVSGVVGLIPAYEIMDLSLSYQFKWFKLEGTVNNLANRMYFTRRATAYPGPGILPSDGRTFYITFQFKI